MSKSRSVRCDRDRHPILIFGITGRSGTNYLFDLIRRHPDVAEVPGLHEDYLFGEAESLGTYVERVRRRWVHQPIGGDEADGLASGLGDAIMRFLSERVDPGSRPVVKTPSPVGLDVAALLLPNTPLLVIVRDGRDVAESARRTFGSSHERWLREWGRNAGLVTRAAKSDFVHVVRYEDLVADPHSELRMVLEAVGLDAETYPWDQLDAVAVRGSSDTTAGGRRAHWRPLEQAELDDFAPVGRWHEWSPRLRRRAETLIGERLAALGYERDEVPRQSSVVAGLWTALHSGSRVRESLGFRTRSYLRRRSADRG